MFKKCGGNDFPLKNIKNLEIIKRKKDHERIVMSLKPSIKKEKQIFLNYDEKPLVEEIQEKLTSPK